MQIQIEAHMILNTNTCFRVHHGNVLSPVIRSCSAQNAESGTKESYRAIKMSDEGGLVLVETM